MNNRERLLERIGDINNFELARPVVSLELFFDGNDDWGSIGYNLPIKLRHNSSAQSFSRFEIETK